VNALPEPKKTITESYLPRSTKIEAIARNNARGEVTMIRGFPYRLIGWETKEDRVYVTMELAK